MAKKVTLITTPFDEFRPNSGNIAYLGKWACFSDENETRDQHVVQLSYHWDDRDKFSKDCAYIERKYEHLLKELAEELNIIHGVNLELISWRIIIGPWLKEFVSILFDRFSVLSDAMEKLGFFDVSIFEVIKYEYLTADSSRLTDLVPEDNWNEAIIARILVFFQKRKKYNLHVIKRPSDVKKRDVDRGTSQNFTFRIKTKFVELILKICMFLAKLLNADAPPSIMIYSTHFKHSLILKIIFRIRYFFSPFPIYNPFTFFVESDINNEKRKDLFSNGVSDDEFVRLCKELLKEYLPIVYLERFSEHRRFGERTNWPKNPKSIFTSTGYNTDDIFKIWAAFCVNGGSKLVVMQHGGLHGMTQYAGFEKHQIDIASSYLSWGWTKKGVSNIIGFGNPNFLSRKPTFRCNGKLLFIQNVAPRYAYKPYEAPIGSQYEDVFALGEDFYIKLCNQIKEKFEVRVYPADYGWDQKQRWRKVSQNISFDRNTKGLDSICIAKGCIFNFLGTGFLQALDLNVPCFLLIKREHYRINEESLRYFENLERCNILHFDSTTLASHLNDCWSDLDRWWFNEVTQEVRSIFCDNFCKPVDVSGVERIFRA